MGRLLDARRFAPYGVVAGLFGTAAFYTGRDAIGSASWPSTTGEVTASSTTADPRSSTSNWTVHVTYTYSVAGVDHRGDGLSFAAETPHGEESARAKVAEYPVGRKVTVFYDPADPSRSMIEREPTSRAWMAMTVFTIVITGAGIAHVVRRRRDPDDSPD